MPRTPRVKVCRKQSLQKKSCRRRTRRNCCASPRVLCKNMFAGHTVVKKDNGHTVVKEDNFEEFIAKCYDACKNSRFLLHINLHAMEKVDKDKEVWIMYCFLLDQVLQHEYKGQRLRLPQIINAVSDFCKNNTLNNTYENRHIQLICSLKWQSDTHTFIMEDLSKALVLVNEKRKNRQNLPSYQNILNTIQQKLFKKAEQKIDLLLTTQPHYCWGYMENTKHNPAYFHANERIYRLATARDKEYWFIAYHNCLEEFPSLRASMLSNLDAVSIRRATWKNFPELDFLSYPEIPDPNVPGNIFIKLSYNIPDLELVNIFLKAFVDGNPDVRNIWNRLYAVVETRVSIYERANERDKDSYILEIPQGKESPALEQFCEVLHEQLNITSRTPRGKTITKAREKFATAKEKLVKNHEKTLKKKRGEKNPIKRAKLESDEMAQTELIKSMDATMQKEMLQDRAARLATLEAHINWLVATRATKTARETEAAYQALYS